MKQQVKQRIGWQKYEDLIEKQISSPLIKTILHNMTQDDSHALDNTDEEENDYDQTEVNHNEELSLVMPISRQLLDDITMSSNFECWVGHTNFDITNTIKEKLDKIQGIEVLKIWSRYRFFIGIGKMFDFTEVRNNIETDIIQGD